MQVTGIFRACARRASWLVPLALGAACVPAPASAAGFDCDASAVRGYVLGGSLYEPVTANRGAQACQSATAGGAGLAIPAVLDGATLSAQTVLDGPADRVELQKAGASGGVTDLGVLSLPDLPIQLPTAQLPAIPPVALPAGLGTVDLAPAVQALVPNGKLPALDLLRVRSAYAFAGGQCDGATPRLDATSQVSGVSVLGQDLSVNQVVEQTLTLINSQVVDPSTANLATVKLPLGVTLDTPLVRSALQAALDALPNIDVPATLATVRVTPGGQERTADSVVQRALRVEVAIAGQSVADLAVGEARVGAAGVQCTTPAAAANQAALQCTKRRLALTDVVRRGDRVRLVGSADRALRGKTVRFVFTSTGRTVARAKVSGSGAFKATAKLPPRRIRDTNRARYQAVVGKEKSLRLKLQRRMKLTGVAVKQGKVTIAGRISRPLASPARTIVIKRRVSCRKTVVVKRVKPRRDGTFRATVSAPPKQLAAVYRLGTRVRKTRKNAKTFPTFTLPRAVALSR